MDDRITKKAARGEHITLICVNHPELSWSTKNIGGIGCRSIFFNLKRDEKMDNECSCSGADLRLSPEYDSLPDVAE